MKPDYKASIPAAESLIREIENHLRPRNLLYAIQDIVDAALGGDPTAWAVAALIAEGGVRRRWCVVHQSSNALAFFSKCDYYEARLLTPTPDVTECEWVWALVFPIPVESAEAKETP